MNRFSRAHGSDLAPWDVAVGRPSPKGPHTMIGATVLAELPLSVRELAPNVSRFVEAAFLHPVLSSQAIKVSGLVRIEGKLELKVFNAQSVKLCVPLTWKLDLLEGILQTFGGDSGPRQPGASEPREVLEPPVSVHPPSSGPPVAWIREHGPTDGCCACRNVMDGKKAGRVCADMPCG